MKWILIIAWAAYGNGYTTQEFETQQACIKAGEWAKDNNYRGGGTRYVCLPNK